MTKKPKRKPRQYWRVVVTYEDGAVSGHRIFSDKARAQKDADKKKIYGVGVKSVVVEPATLTPARRFRSPRG